MSIQIVICAHGVDLRTAKCFLCADPAFHAAQQPGLPAIVQLMTGQPDPRDAELTQVKQQLAEAREALKPMVNGTAWITAEDVARARAALGEPNG